MVRSKDSVEIIKVCDSRTKIYSIEKINEDYVVIGLCGSFEIIDIKT